MSAYPPRCVQLRSYCNIYAFLTLACILRPKSLTLIIRLKNRQLPLKHNSTINHSKLTVMRQRLIKLIMENYRSLTPFLLIAAFTILLFSACKMDKPAGDNPICVKLNKNDIQKWIDDGYIKPGERSKYTVNLRAAYAFPGKGYRLYAALQNADGSLIEKSVIRLDKVDTCSVAHIKLSPYILLGTMRTSLADWNIWDGVKLKDSFSFIRLEPFNYKDSQGISYLALNEFTIDKWGHIITSPTTTGTTTFQAALPCPPCDNCRPPCPGECQSCNKFDSTAEQQ